MTGGDRPGPPPDPAGDDLHDLARDWITLWQSELAALAVDREAQETWHVLLSLWAGAAGAMIRAMPRGMPDEPARRDRRARPHGARSGGARSGGARSGGGPNGDRRDGDGPDGDGQDGDGPDGAGSAAAAGAEAAAAAPDPRDAEVDRLRDRVAELERRLAGLERRRRRTGKPDS